MSDSITTPLDERRLWDEGEVAFYFCVTRATVARWRKAGHLVGFVLPTGVIRYKPEDVRSFAEARAWSAR